MQAHHRGRAQHEHQQHDRCGQNHGSPDGAAGVLRLASHDRDVLKTRGGEQHLPKQRQRGGIAGRQAQCERGVVQRFALEPHPERCDDQQREGKNDRSAAHIVDPLAQAQTANRGRSEQGYDAAQQCVNEQVVLG